MASLQRIFWVAHTHWDREWYRSFQAFRARLVDTVDALLALLESDDDYRFLLDGQCVVLDDYLAVRPQNEARLHRLVSCGRLAIGPWYVQPDCLIPWGESHIRNLLRGLEICTAFGRMPRVAYTPDSFGHPAQFPQLLSGVGLDSFVFWRGSGSEADELPAEFRWTAPDGSSVTACLLWRGYFSGALLPRDPELAVPMLCAVVAELAARTQQGVVALMNGIDHAAADPAAHRIAASLETALGVPVQMGLLEDFTAAIARELPPWRGRLDGARVAPLLPGVWSARMALKLRNRETEIALLHGAETWAALGSVFGLPDERAALRLAWDELLKNQAHDSLGGCSIDQVHRDMLGRYAGSAKLAEETARRMMERLAGLAPERQTPVSEPWQLAVFNPLPVARSGIVRLALDADPVLPARSGGVVYHPVLAANTRETGFLVDGVPARVIETPSSGRFISQNDAAALSIEFEVDALPPCGFRLLRLERGAAVAGRRDAGTEIGNERIRVGVDPETGGVSIESDGRRFDGLLRFEDCGDRGDAYDADLLDDSRLLVPETLRVRRLAHPGGVHCLELDMVFRVPEGLDEGRRERPGPLVELEATLVLRLGRASRALDVDVRIDNRARDHRLRLLFDTGKPALSWRVAAMLDGEERCIQPVDDRGWVHPAPRTFVHHGWISVNGLTVVAAGLPEAEVLADGTLALTLLRCVGWLSRADLGSRSGPAGPTLPVPEAQCQGALDARVSLFVGSDPCLAQCCMIPAAAVFAAPRPVAEANRPLLRLERERLLLGALKPPQRGRGIVLRLYNPRDADVEDALITGFDLACVHELNLAEEVLCEIGCESGRRVELRVRAHQWKTLLLETP